MNIEISEFLSFFIQFMIAKVQKVGLKTIRQFLIIYHVYISYYYQAKPWVWTRINEKNDEYFISYKQSKPCKNNNKNEKNRDVIVYLCVCYKLL